MSNDDRIRLTHMIEAGQEAQRFAERRERKDLDNDRMLTLALVKAIEIIGEAASKTCAPTGTTAQSLSS